MERFELGEGEDCTSSKTLASSTYPISGARPQESINKQIVLKSDLLICIFGARLGAPTGNEMSGSIEEINEHLKVGKDVMVFFKNSGSYDIDPDQLKKVRDYQNSIKDSVLWVTVKDEDEFRRFSLTSYSYILTTTGFVILRRKKYMMTKS